MLVQRGLASLTILIYNQMKRTSSPWKVLGITLLVSAIATFILQGLAYLIGSATVALWCVGLIPVVFVWCLVTTETRLARPKQYTQDDYDESLADTQINLQKDQHHDD